MSKIKYIITFLVLCVISQGTIKAQDDRHIIDSLIQKLKTVPEGERITILNDLSKLYWNYSLDSSFYYANEALSLAHIIQDKKGLSDSYNRIANVYYFQGLYEKSMEFYQKSLVARKQTDDLVGIANIYNNMAVLYSNQGEYEKSLEYFNEALNLSTSIRDNFNMASYLSSIAGVYVSMENYRKALEYYLKSLEITKELGEEQALARLYRSIGNVYSEISSYDMALNYFLDALEIYKKNNDQPGLSAMYNNIGIIYQNFKENEKALLYFQKSLDIEIIANNEAGQSTAYNNIGTVHDELGNKTKALEYYNKSLIINKKYNNEEGISTALNNIGLIYLDLGEYNKAIQNLSESLVINKKRNDTWGIANNYNNLAKLNLRQKKYSEAKNHLSNSIDLCKQVDAKDLLVEAYDFLYIIYSDENNYQKALEYFKLYSEMNDSIFSKDANNRIAEMKIKYETENIESENELLRKNNEIHLLQIKRQKNLQRYWIAFTVLILALTILGFSQVRLKKKTNNLLESKNNQLKDANDKLSSSEQNLKELNATKDKFFSIIAHDLKNPFQALLGFSETLYTRHHELSDTEVKEYSKIIYESSQNLFNLLGNLLQWSKSQLGSIKLSPEKLVLADILDEATSLLTLSAEKKNIKLKSSVPFNFTVFADKHIVSTVLRNLVSNAIKFTNHGGEILISSEINNNEAIITISDNGLGIKPENLDKLFKIDYSYSTKGTDNEQGTGLGLILCKELVEENNGRIWCESTYGKGSKFYFTLPIKE